ncbi:MAG: protein BatD [Prolixibacteraceae bacterium]|nr:protein BatD [Prolixibacteraceae bacterium]
MIFKKLLITILFLIPALFAGADNTQFTMSGPEVISTGEQFRLSFSLNDKGEDLQLPDLSDFNILMGPSTSQSSSFQMINGKTSRSVSYSYIYILSAKKEGKFTIQPASVKVNGEIYKSNSLTIQVVKGQSNSSSQSQGNSSSGNGYSQQQQQQHRASSSIGKNDLFVKTHLSRSSAFKGQQIIATVKIYVAQNVPISNFSDVKVPSYEGFWTQDIEIPNQVNFTREVYKNKIYQVGILKKTILFPQQTGKLKIDPFEITCDIKQRVSNQRGFFDDFFDNYRTVSAKAVSDPVYLTVKDLPAAPSGFCGGVGNMNFYASIDKDKVKANEAITLKVKISGTGNLKLINAPKIKFPTDFEIYDPKSTDSQVASENGQTGSKSFEYLIIPRHAGDYSIQPFSFSSFNPSTGKYNTESSKTFKIHVDPGNEEQNQTVTSAYSKEDVRFIGKDIRYIKQNQYKIKQKNSFFYGTLNFWMYYILTVVIFMIIIIIYRKKIKENANVQLVKTKKANKIARKRLKKAKEYLQQNKSEEFYKSVLSAVMGYLGDKLNIPIADLNRDKAIETLKDKNVKQETIDELIKILDTCEFAQYSPSSTKKTIADVYSKAAQLMGQFEKQISINKKRKK